MDADEYTALSPENQAEIVSAYRGYEDSRSVDSLASALPGPVDAITFWGGKETDEKLAEYDRDLRREVLEDNFETHLTFGVMPDEAALTFAFGDDEFSMDLQGQDALAFEYATAVAGVPDDTSTAEAFAATVQALAEAPSPAELAKPDVHVERVLAKWEERYGDPSDEEGGIAAAAQSVAASLMESLGFDWV
jgi:hypothetical protein